MAHRDLENGTVTAAGILLMTRSEPGRPPDHFLLMRHTDRWDLPKGHAEAGENPRQTALRETEEETGIDAADIELDPEFEFRITYPVQYRTTGDRVFDKTVYFYLGFVDRCREVRCSEHLGFRWFPWQPPHRIQARTIDPLLEAVEAHLDRAA